MTTGRVIPEPGFAADFDDDGDVDGADLAEWKRPARHWLFYPNIYCNS